MFPDFKDGSAVEQMTRTSSPSSSNLKAEVLSARLDQDQRLRVKVTLRIRSGTLKGGKPGKLLNLTLCKQIQTDGTSMCTSRPSSTQPPAPEQQYWRDRLAALSEGEFLKDLIFEESATVIFLAVISAKCVIWLFSVLEFWELGLALVIVSLNRICSSFLSSGFFLC